MRDDCQLDSVTGLLYNYNNNKMALLNMYRGRFNVLNLLCIFMLYSSLEANKLSISHAFHRRSLLEKIELVRWGDWVR